MNVSELLYDRKPLLRRVIRAWQVLWGVIGALALLVGLVEGLITLHKYFFVPVESVSHVTEYIFADQYAYVQALVDTSDKVVAYGVTARTNDFHPSLTILDDAYTTDPKDPTNEDKYTSLKKKILLGETKFAQLGTSDNIFGYLGARRMYYHEEYYYGNPGNYQSYFFAVNDSGPTHVDTSDLMFLNDSPISATSSAAQQFRQDSVINTYYVTAPFGGMGDSDIRSYLVGPDYDQVRVIPDSLIETTRTVSQEYAVLSKLSTEVDIQYFVDSLGRPTLINNSPYLQLRNDVPINEKWNTEFESMYPCDHLTVKDVVSGLTVRCAKQILSSPKGLQVLGLFLPFGTLDNYFLARILFHIYIGNRCVI